jgi:hypothetical protein
MYGGTRGWCGHARYGTRCRRVQFANFDRHTPIEGEDVFDGGGPHSLGTRHRRLGVNIGDHLLPLQLLFVGHEVEAVGKIGNHPAHRWRISVFESIDNAEWYVGSRNRQITILNWV